MALTGELLKKLKPPVYYTLPTGHEDDSPPGIMNINGKRHENVNQAVTFFKNHKKVLSKELSDFEMILIVIRNPYELVVSRYHYLLLNHPWDKGPAKEIALKSSFQEFAINAPHYFTLAKYMLYKNAFPKNLHIIRYEDLHSQINPKIKKYLKSTISLSEKNNTTSHKKWQDYITNKGIENSIYLKFKYVFDKGFYSRYIV